MVVYDTCISSVLDFFSKTPFTLIMRALDLPVVNLLECQSLPTTLRTEKEISIRRVTTDSFQDASPTCLLACQIEVYNKI